ncbi:hypothetical protein [Winogradskya humida]|nr:hypothetical protein [Actinoplanes humidus]
MTALQVGERVTVRVADTDPIEVVQHKHVLVAEAKPNGMYLVTHAPIPGSREAPRNYGPFARERLIKGWDTP